MGICLIIKSGGGVDTSSATATADKILSGYTIYSNDNKITGSMTNIGNQAKNDSTHGNTTTGQYNFAWNKLTSAGVWAGWHDGTCIITTPSLSDSTQCDIPDTNWCLNGYTYWKSGTKYTGTMSSRGTKSWTMAINGSEIKIESGWHSGSGTVKQSPTVNTSSEWKLMRPTTSNQTLCSSGWYYSQNRWCEGASTLAKENIKSGVTIFGITGTWSGWVDSTVPWSAISGAVCNPGEYIASGGTKLTPSQRVFGMSLDWPTYAKLINTGMVYLNWSATTNIYKTTKNWDYPLLSGSFWGTFSNTNTSKHVGSWNYPNADWVLPSASSRKTWVSMYTKMYTGGYGTDNNVSGKYDIKTPYDKFKGFNANKCVVEFEAGVSLTEPGDGFRGSDGKVWVKSFNFWFSKS